MSQYFSQNDPKWKFQMLGHNTHQDGTIGNFGCLITSLCNACLKLGVKTFYVHNRNQVLELNPSWLDEELTHQDSGYADRGLYVWESLDRSVEHGINELPFLFQNSYRFNEFKNEIKTKIESGKFVCLIEVDSIPATATQDMHWVLIESIDGDNVTIVDAWDGQVKPLSDYFGATVKRPNDTIYSAKFITRENFEGSQEVEPTKEKTKAEIAKERIINSNVFDDATKKVLHDAVTVLDFEYLVGDSENVRKSFKELSEEFELLENKNQNCSKIVDSFSKDLTLSEEKNKVKEDEIKRLESELLNSKNLKLSSIFTSKSVHIFITSIVTAITSYQTNQNWQVSLGILLTGIATLFSSAYKDSQKINNNL